MVSPSNLVRVGGGLASATAGVLLLLGHVLDLGGDPEYGTVLGGSSVLAAHVLLVFALVALYAAQAEQSGSFLGAPGMVFGVVGTTLASGVILIEIAGASGAEVGAVLGAGLSGTLSLLGGLAFFVGLILLGIATMRAGVFSWWAGLLLILGDVVFAAASFSGSAALVVEVIGALLTCAAFVWLGLTLLPGSGALAQQPARVS
jgi:hypothetical protein